MARKIPGCSSDKPVSVTAMIVLLTHLFVSWYLFNETLRVVGDVSRAFCKPQKKKNITKSCRRVLDKNPVSVPSMPIPFEFTRLLLLLVMKFRISKQNRKSHTRVEGCLQFIAIDVASYNLRRAEINIVGRRKESPRISFVVITAAIVNASMIRNSYTLRGSWNRFGSRWSCSNCLGIRSRRRKQVTHN